MSRTAAVPHELTTAPFVGAAAVAAGLLTRRQLQGGTWRRVLPDIYAWAGLTLDHHRDRSQFQRDLRRMNALNACGWTVLRFGARDIRDNPDRLVAAVRAAR